MSPNELAALFLLLVGPGIVCWVIGYRCGVNDIRNLAVVALFLGLPWHGTSPNPWLLRWALVGMTLTGLPVILGVMTLADIIYSWLTGGKR